jgi:Protein of unknown function (DUF1064)
MNKYHAKRTQCLFGHLHDSKREAGRCNELHDDQRRGKIVGLTLQPKFQFYINGIPIKMGNGHVAKYTPDFSYSQNGQLIVEDVKGFVVRDFPLRAALFRALFPDWKLLVTK